MKSRTTKKFRQALAELPDQVRKQARIAYRQFKKNPNHPSLRFKKVHQKLPITDQVFPSNTKDLI